jgi:hypothetical protein
MFFNFIPYYFYDLKFYFFFLGFAFYGVSLGLMTKVTSFEV